MWLAPLPLAALLFALVSLTELDLWFSRFFFDKGTMTWPWRDHWLTETLLHKGGKLFVLLLGLTCLAGFPLSFFRRFRAYRRVSLFLFLGIALSAGLVGFLKHRSPYHCPWDLIPFGGSAVYVKLFQPVPKGQVPGHCFPGGHASGGFALMALFFALRERSRSWARRGFLAGFLVGNLFGFAQIMRGAHFLSHHLWTALIVWYICLGLYRFGFRGRLWHSAAKPPGRENA